MTSGQQCAGVVHEALAAGLGMTPAMKRYEKDTRARIGQYWEFIENFYTLHFAQIFFQPTNRFRMVCAINAVLAGCTKLSFAAWWRLQGCRGGTDRSEVAGLGKRREASNSDKEGTSLSMRFLNFLLSTAALLFLLSSCSSPTMKQPPLKTVPYVDLQRYMGDWHVFANIPYFLEKGKVGTVDRYTLRPDGKMDNVFLFRRGSLEAPVETWNGVAWVHDKKSNAEWRVQLLWPFRVPYLIIDLDPEYQWSVVGYPSRKLAWVLTRGTTLDEGTYRGILERLKAQ
eukprot:gene50352-61599_t